MSSSDKEINNLVVTLSSFIRDVVTVNIAEAKQKGIIKIDAENSVRTCTSRNQQGRLDS